MKRLCIHIGIIFLFGQACNLSVNTSLTTPGVMATEASPLTMTVTQLNDPSPTLRTLPPHRLTQKRCGDGICDIPENAANCLADCPEDINTQQLPIPKGTPVLEVSVVPNGTLPTEEVGLTTTLSGEGCVYQVTNPTSGAVLFVQVFHPNGWKCETLPALVLVPGGIGWSANFTDSPGSANILANTGFAVVIFDPDGHGRSQGSEDYDGFAHQDGLGAVINFTTGLPEVDKNRIGLISFSYGITMASGTLSRYPDLPVIFLIDWEGPADRYDTTTCCDVSKSRISWKPCDDEGFWRQREALTFIAKVQVPYQRIQSEKDHVQPDVSHAVNMINVALSGSVPWARLNDFQPNQTYYPNAPPVMIPETQSRNLAPMVAKYAQKMLLLFGQWGVVVWNHSKM